MIERGDHNFLIKFGSISLTVGLSKEYKEIYIQSSIETLIIYFLKSVVSGQILTDSNKKNGFFKFLFLWFRVS